MGKQTDWWDIQDVYKYTGFHTSFGYFACGIGHVKVERVCEIVRLCRMGVFLLGQEIMYVCMIELKSKINSLGDVFQCFCHGTYDVL